MVAASGPYASPSLRRAMRDHDGMGTELPSCYFASPLGFTDDGVRLLHDRYLPALRRVVTPVNPWDLTRPEELSAASTAGELRELRRKMGRRNADAIEKSALLVAYLEGQELDSRTVAEISYASELVKRCFGIRPDDARQESPKPASICRSNNSSLGAVETSSTRSMSSSPLSSAPSWTSAGRSRRSSKRVGLGCV